MHEHRPSSSWYIGTSSISSGYIYIYFRPCVYSPFFLSFSHSLNRFSRLQLFSFHFYLTLPIITDINKCTLYKTMYNFFYRAPFSYLLQFFLLSLSLFLSKQTTQITHHTRLHIVSKYKMISTISFLSFFLLSPSCLRLSFVSIPLVRKKSRNNSTMNNIERRDDLYDIHVRYKKILTISSTVHRFVSLKPRVKGCPLKIPIAKNHEI